MRKTKILVLCLSCILLIAVLCACGKDTEPARTSESADLTAETSEATTEQVDYTPKPVDYGKHTFTVLSAGNVAFDDFSQLEPSEVVLDQALYERKKKVEADFNIEIVTDVQKARSVGDGPGYRLITQDALSGSQNYDAALIAGYDVAVLAREDMLYDLNSLPGLDLSRPYWDQNANRDLAINGVMFFTTGEITVSDNNALFTLLFNKKLIDDYQLISPYEYVSDDNWTLETFASLVKGVSEDLNGDGVRDENDRYGLLVWDDAIMAIIDGAGEKCATVGADGKINLTLYNDRTASILDRYFNIIYDENTAICYQRKLKSASGIWNNNQGLFWMSTLGNVPKLRTMEADFGIVPYPKADNKQEAYHQTISPYNSQFYCVPKLSKEPERTGRILDALAYYGAEIVTPAYYEKTIVGQSARDEESIEMLDIILASTTFDFGYYYQLGTYNSQLIYMVREYDRGFTTRYETYRVAAETQLADINDAYAKAVAAWKS